MRFEKDMLPDRGSVAPPSAWSRSGHGIHGVGRRYNPVHQPQSGSSAFGRPSRGWPQSAPAPAAGEAAAEAAPMKAGRTEDSEGHPVLPSRRNPPKWARRPEGRKTGDGRARGPPPETRAAREGRESEGH